MNMERKFPGDLEGMFNPHQKLSDKPEKTVELPVHFPSLAKAIMTTYGNVFNALAKWERESDKKLAYKEEPKKDAGRRSR